MDIRNRQELMDYINRGKKVKYLYFWGHQPNKSGETAKSCFSQWFESSFKVDGRIYKTAEHYMMAQKANLFDDENTMEKILQARHPGEAKQLGRQVKGFNENVWIAKRFDFVVEGNSEKFLQNEELMKYLIQTGERILVEASPVDKIWGVGLSEDDVKIRDPYKWKGLNLLGFALMEVRDIVLRNETLKENINGI